MKPRTLVCLLLGVACVTGLIVHVVTHQTPPSAEATPWTNQVPLSMFQPIRLQELLVGKTVCTPFFALSATGHVWLTDPYGPDGNHLVPPSWFGGCQDNSVMLTRHVDGLHVHLFTSSIPLVSKATPLAQDGWFFTQGYEMAVVVSH